MNSLRQHLARALVALALVYAAFSAIQFVNPPLSDAWSVEMEARFRELRPYLPPSGKVGFITNKSEEDSRVDTMVLQYAIAPVVLMTDPDCCELTIASFDGSANTIAALTAEYHIVKDLGNG
jgi:hypothetical protein